MDPIAENGSALCKCDHRVPTPPDCAGFHVRTPNLWSVQPPAGIVVGGSVRRRLAGRDIYRSAFHHAAVIRTVRRQLVLLSLGLGEESFPDVLVARYQTDCYIRRTERTALVVNTSCPMTNLPIEPI